MDHLSEAREAVSNMTPKEVDDLIRKEDPLSYSVCIEDREDRASYLLAKRMAKEEA